MVSPTLDFGKHRGKRVCEVPTPYLRWMVRECENLHPELRRAIVEELQRRCPGTASSSGSKPGSAAGQNGDGCRSLVDVRSVLRTWHREMVLRFHPDRTLDDGKQMAAINVAVDRLRELLGVA